MKLPQGSIFISVVISVCILVLGAGAGAAGTPPADGTSPGWQIGAQQGMYGGEHAPPGNGGQIPPCQIEDLIGSLQRFFDHTS